VRKHAEGFNGAAAAAVKAVENQRPHHAPPSPAYPKRAGGPLHGGHPVRPHGSRSASPQRGKRWRGLEVHPRSGNRHHRGNRLAISKH
jgi:hypothetical protein